MGASTNDFSFSQQTVSSIPSEFQSCAEKFDPRKDERYTACFTFLSNDSDFCEYLNYANLVNSFPYYFLGLIPLFLSMFAVITNIIFTYIAVLVIKDKHNKSRKTFMFLLIRSITTIISQILFYIVLTTWKSDEFGYLSTVIFLTIGSLSFLTIAGTYFILSIRNYVNLTRKYNFLTMKKCAILNGILWIYDASLSIFIGIFGSTFIFPEQSPIKCNFENCQKPFAITITILLGVSYFLVLLTYFCTFIKVKNFTTTAKFNAIQINTRNDAIMRRILYNIIVFACTKISFLVVCGFTVYDLHNFKDLAKEEESYCTHFLHGKLYFKAEILASVTIFIMLFGMIADPIIYILSDFTMIKTVVVRHLKNFN